MRTGLPRAARGWQHTFTQANQRIAALGLSGFSATPHVLRDSCALRWFAVGRLAYEPRFGHVSEQETKDCRVQFGDTWVLVATILVSPTCRGESPLADPPDRSTERGLMPAWPRPKPHAIRYSTTRQRWTDPAPKRAVPDKEAAS